MMKPPNIAPPNPKPKTPKSNIPGGSCDCHFHVFDGPSRQIATRSYSTQPAKLEAYRSVQTTLGLDRAVIVQPSIYGIDNRTTLHSIPNDGSMKAVIVVNDRISRNDLSAFAKEGAVGARVNMLFSSGAHTADLLGLAEKLADIGWHLQILTDVSEQAELLQDLINLPVPVVLDHMGHVPTSKGVDDAGFQALLASLDSGKIWAKLSGAYRLTTGGSEAYEDVTPMAKALISANPERLVWGSDWPHPAFNGHMPNDGDLLDLLFDWTDHYTAKRILVDNPERLYGFSKWKTIDGT